MAKRVWEVLYETDKRQEVEVARELVHQRFVILEEGSPRWLLFVGKYVDLLPLLEGTSPRFVIADGPSDALLDLAQHDVWLNAFLKMWRAKVIDLLSALRGSVWALAKSISDTRTRWPTPGYPALLMLSVKHWDSLSEWEEVVTRMVESRREHHNCAASWLLEFGMGVAAVAYSVAISNVPQA